MRRIDQRWGWCAMIGLLAVTLTGCKMEHVESTGTDDAFIRLPGDKPTPLPPTAGPLWPLTTGNRWVYSVVTANRDGKTAPTTGKETLVVLGPKTVGPGSGVAVQVLQNDKPFREEVLRLDDKGLSLVAAGIASGGGTDTMSIINDDAQKQSGIPLVRFPVTPGDIARWDGILKLNLKRNQKDVAAPGTSNSRVSMLEKIRTPAGEFQAYRVETMIQTTVDRQQIFLYTIRWLAPGVGMVQQRVMTTGQVVTKDLLKFDRK